jgi:hypothetical protein
MGQTYQMHKIGKIWKSDDDVFPINVYRIFAQQQLFSTASFSTSQLALSKLLIEKHRTPISSM